MLEEGSAGAPGEAPLSSFGLAMSFPSSTWPSRSSRRAERFRILYVKSEALKLQVCSLEKRNQVPQLRNAMSVDIMNEMSQAMCSGSNSDVAVLLNSFGVVETDAESLRNHGVDTPHGPAVANALSHQRGLKSMSSFMEDRTLHRRRGLIAHLMDANSSSDAKGESHSGGSELLEATITDASSDSRFTEGVAVNLTALTSVDGKCVAQAFDELVPSSVRFTSPVYVVLDDAKCLPSCCQGNRWLN